MPACPVAVVGCRTGDLVETGVLDEVDLGGSWSSRFSMGGVFPSECNPTGFNGSRNVPLLGRGSTRSESHTILYTSIFSRWPLASISQGI